MGNAIFDNPTVWERAVPITVEAYHFLYRNGLVSEKTELLEGVVVEKMPKDPIHANIVTNLAYYLYEKLKNKFQVRQENPIYAGFSEPEPDIAIVPNKDYSTEHPKEVFIVIEVANTSLGIDRAKTSIYAGANIPEYIIVNLQNNILEIYSVPIEGQYSLTKILQIEEIFSSKSIPAITFSLKDFLPKI